MGKILVLFAAFLWTHLGALQPTAGTYFLYAPEDIQSLQRYDAHGTITQADILKWDPFIEELGPRAKTYLYAAQQEGFELTHRVSKEGDASLDPLSLGIVRLFKPDFDVANVPNYRSTLFADELAGIVLPKFQERLKHDDERIRPYTLLTGTDHWTPDGEPFGISSGNWLPWTLCSASEFRGLVPPPFRSPAWQQQMDAVRLALKNVNAEQKEQTLYWAGELPDRQDREWLVYATRYMQKKGTPVPQFLQVRSDLGMAVNDAVIAAFDSKYAYGYPRPHQGDSSLQPLVKMPNHPSYPSAHSVCGAAAAEVLSFYFPEDAPFWKQRGVESGHSRIWGGLHYPMDHVVGATMGKKVGDHALQALRRKLWIQN